MRQLLDALRARRVEIANELDAIDRLIRIHESGGKARSYDVSEASDAPTLAIPPPPPQALKNKEQTILFYVGKAGRPLEMSEIVELAKDFVSRSSVYRVVNKLVESGLLVVEGGKYRPKSSAESRTT